MIRWSVFRGSGVLYMDKVEEPLISVIITVYNLEDYVEKCISSVSAQSYSNLQIIVVDDGSTDKSLMICKSLAEKDKRIEIVHQENRGAGAAKNRGIQQAVGEYIGFVDGDDYIERDMYATLIKASLDYEAEIVWCGRNVVDEEGKVLYQLFAHEPALVCNGRELLKKIVTWDGCDS